LSSVAFFLVVALVALTFVSVSFSAAFVVFFTFPAFPTLSSFSSTSSLAPFLTTAFFPFTGTTLSAFAFDLTAFLGFFSSSELDDEPDSFFFLTLLAGAFFTVSVDGFFFLVLATLPVSSSLQHELLSLSLHSLHSFSAAFSI